MLRGDGIGADVGGVPGITTCAVRVLDAAVARAYAGRRQIHRFDVHAGDAAAMFEATHGTAPNYTGKNLANPGAVLLSGVLLLEYLGWFEAAERVNRAVEMTFGEAEETAMRGPDGKLHVTYDIARQFAGYGPEAGPVPATSTTA